MRCEIKNSECDIPEMDCSKCELAETTVSQATEEYLTANNAVIPNYEIIKHEGIITTVWFQNPIAEISKGVMQVARHGL